jgi:hypothetical protein
MHETVDGSEIDEDAEGRDAADRAFHYGAFRDVPVEGIPLG